MGDTKVKLSKNVSDVSISSPVTGQALIFGGSQWANTNVATNDGWISANETWTYASATTITVPSDATTRYSKGDKIRLKQNGPYRYFYVVAVSATTLTLTGGSDYSVANYGITDNYYSKAASPLGFPKYFNYTPTWTSSGTAPSIGNGSISGKFSIEGGYIFALVYQTMGSTTTYGTGVYYWSMPCAISQATMGSAMAFDSGTAFHIGITQPSGSSIVALTEAQANNWGQTLPHTWAQNDYLYLTMSAWL